MTTKQPSGDPTTVVDRIQAATNQHDLDALAGCFAPDFLSTFPAHPDRTFQGQGQLRKNWSQIFAGVPDLEAVLLRRAGNGDTVWAEWEWRGRRTDGAQLLMRGVTIHGVQDGQTAWVRLYMEPVQEGAGADVAIRQTMGGEVP